jgi:drug/metabolite transporter (DMT)-like permease
LETLLQANGLLALLAAGFWGCGDFSGGMAVRKAGGRVPSVSAAVRVILVSHAASLGVLLAIALLCGDRFPQGDVLGCALVCGVFGALAVIAFYLALSRGAMGASAAVSGLLAAASPSCVAMIQEGHPGWRRGTGFFVAGVAIWLIAGGTASGRRESRSTLRLAILAGAGFGIYFVALKFAATGGLIWPMAAARMASLTTVSLWLALLWFGRAPGVSVTSRMSATAIRWALSTALFDTAGNLAFMAATRVGRLDVASVLASLYPASTILLAGWILKEKPTRQQALGMLVAAAAVVMITL